VKNEFFTASFQASPTVCSRSWLFWHYA